MTDQNDQNEGAYYNENDVFAGKWLKNLSAAGHINTGTVDTRSIELLSADDVKDATQAHFFAGVGVWSHALREAGWPDDVPVWTGSCPCQPFSVAGRRKGEDDARHLWPVWLELIKQCRPPAIFGEQVASPAGRDWFATVSADLEALGYLVVAADLCAAGVGAPHLRQRLFFGAVLGPLADASGDGREEVRFTRAWANASTVKCLDGKSRPFEPDVYPLADGAASRVGRLRAYGNAIVPQVAAVFIRSFIDALGDMRGTP